MPDDRAIELSVEANKLVETLGPISWKIEERSIRREIAHALDIFAAQAVQRALTAVRQIIDDVSGEGSATDIPPNWINACTAIDNRVRGLIAVSPLAAPRSDIEEAVRKAVEQERERIYKAAEIRWLRGFMEEVRAVLTPD